MPDLELGQFRMRILDDFELRMSTGSQVVWRLRSNDFVLTKFPTESEEDFLKQRKFADSEFFQWERDILPHFDLYSELGSTQSRIIFSGYRFHLTKVVVGSAQKQIIVSGTF